MWKKYTLTCFAAWNYGDLWNIETLLGAGRFKLKYHRHHIVNTVQCSIVCYQLKDIRVTGSQLYKTTNTQWHTVPIKPFQSALSGTKLTEHTCKIYFSYQTFIINKKKRKQTNTTRKKFSVFKYCRKIVTIIIRVKFAIFFFNPSDKGNTKS